MRFFVLAAVALARPAVAVDLRERADISEHVRLHAVDLSWSSVFAGPERAIYVGERHPDLRPKDELAANMKAAAEAGITHLAVEMLGRDRADLLERYHARTATEAELIAAFEEDWGPDTEGYMPASYARVVHAAREAGIRTAPLDLSKQEKYNLYWDCRDAGRGKKDCEDLELAKRDDQMGKSLVGLLRREGVGRVLAWTGAWHACALEHRAYVARAGFPTRGYYFVAGGPYDQETGISNFVTAAAERGWGERRLLVPTSGAHDCFEGFILMPGADRAAGYVRQPPPP